MSSRQVLSSVDNLEGVRLIWLWYQCSTVAIDAFKHAEIHKPPYQCEIAGEIAGSFPTAVRQSEQQPLAIETIAVAAVERIGGCRSAQAPKPNMLATQARKDNCRQMP